MYWLKYKLHLLMDIYKSPINGKINFALGNRFDILPYTTM